MKFSKGETVRAKWPGSSLYYEGVVVESGADDALVRFEEGTEYRIGIKHIKNDNMFKSPGRPSNPNSTPPRMSTRRSPARSSKSPARSSKSPARSSKSPARTSKSPTRTSKSPARTSKSPARTSKSPGRISKKSSKEEITSSSSKSQTAKIELTPPTKKKSSRSPTRKANSVAEPVVSVKKVSVTSKPFGTTVSRTTVLETKKSVRSFETADEPHLSATKDGKTYITGREQRPLLSEDFKLSFLGRQPHLLVPSREHTWRKPTITSTHEDSTEMTYKFSSIEPPRSRERFSQQREDSPFVSIARRSIRGDSPFLVADRGSTRSDSPSVSTAGRSVREDSPAVTLLRRETRGSVLREVNSHSTPIREITPVPSQIYSPKFKLHDYKPIVEFGGWLGALAFIFILPLSVLALHLHCNKTSCSFVDNKLNIPLNWQAYFDPMAAAIYLGFVAFLLVLYFLPVGERIEAVDSRAVSYRCNGFITTLVALVVVGGLHYQGYPVSVVYDKYIQLIVSSLVFGFLLALILYIKGGTGPINGKNHIYLFWMGREVTPHFGPVAIKVLIFRIGVIGSVVLTSALVVKHFGPNPAQYSPTLVVSVAMQVIYLLDSLWFEKVWATSFEFKYEGVGAMLAAGYCVYPFINTLVVKYIVEHRVELPPYYLAALATLFIVGLVIFRLSNNLKDEFRTNPLSRKLEGVETISSFGGKKLLVSSWWGWLRHPNYLGDILIHWAWGLTCGWPIVLPYFLALATTMLLVHRAVRDDIRCKQRYGTAWDRYCSRVKYRIVPHVF